MIKWIFKWMLRLVLLAVVLIVILALSYNSILRILIEHNIRSQTGMDAEIGRFQLGIFEPTLTIQDLKIYNPPSFGGTPFLKIPEIHLEYDRNALARQKLHFTLVRFNLGELDIVKNARGETNIFSLGLALPKKNQSNAEAAKEFKRQTGLEFVGIDSLNVSVGTLKYIDLQNQHHNRTQNVDLENWVVPHVKTLADLGGLEGLVALRGSDFFTSLAPHDSKSNLLQMLW